MFDMQIQSSPPRAQWEQAAAQWEACGLDHELARTRALIESLDPG